MKMHLAYLVVLVAASTLYGLGVGPVVGSRNAAVDLDQFWGFGYAPVQAGMVGVRAEQKLGPIVAGLDAGFVGWYEQASSGGMNGSRHRTYGIEARLSVELERSLVRDRLAARGGVSLAYDAARSYSYTAVVGDASFFTQALCAGLQAGPFGRVKVGLNADLNLVREGTFRSYDYTETFDMNEITAGTLAPGLSLCVLFGL
jgi:hypothetical protein